MSAMHWEARRRQNALDRRTARIKQQLSQGGSETSCTATEPNTAQEPAVPAGGQCPHCKRDLKPQVQHSGSGKIPNRYSSLQYSQQW